MPIGNVEGENTKDHHSLTHVLFCSLPYNAGLPSRSAGLTHGSAWSLRSPRTLASQAGATGTALRGSTKQSLNGRFKHINPPLETAIAVLLHTPCSAKGNTNKPADPIKAAPSAPVGGSCDICWLTYVYSFPLLCSRHFESILIGANPLEGDKLWEQLYVTGYTSLAAPEYAAYSCLWCTQIGYPSLFSCI